VETLACVNGEILPAAGKHISPLDRGFRYGWGLFETLAVRNGRILFAREHLARLRAGAGQLSINLSSDDRCLQGYLEACRQANGIRDGSLRLTVTAGPASGETCTIVTLGPPLYTDGDYRRGFRIGVVGIRRNRHSPSVRLKTLNYLDNILSRQEARSNGWDEGVLLNTEGLVAECSASNIFIVRQGRLFTPHADCGLLAGIVRAKVLTLARRLGLNVSEATLGIDDLENAEEIFLTNSVMGVMPVSYFNDQPVGPSFPGPFTRKLADGYGQLVSSLASKR